MSEKRVGWEGGAERESERKWFWWERGRQGKEESEPIQSRDSHAMPLERTERKKIELIFQKYAVLTLARVIYQGKYFESKQVVYQVGFIPRRSFIEVPV